MSEAAKATQKTRPARRGWRAKWPKHLSFHDWIARLMGWALEAHSQGKRLCAAAYTEEADRLLAAKKAGLITETPGVAKQESTQ